MVISWGSLALVLTATDDCSGKVSFRPDMLHEDHCHGTPLFNILLKPIYYIDFSFSKYLTNYSKIPQIQVL